MSAGEKKAELLTTVCNAKYTIQNLNGVFCVTDSGNFKSVQGERLVFYSTC